MIAGNCAPTVAVSPVLGLPRIYREVTFDVETFDHLKAWHRELERVHGHAITNSELLRVLILSVPAPPVVVARLHSAGGAA